MIALDSSILAGVLNREADALELMDLLMTEECVIGAPTLVEVRVWWARNFRATASAWLEAFIGKPEVSVVPFSREMADTASGAFLAYGRGRGHPAQLNYGDCMSYAVSAVLRAPLLFKGTDFAQTDVLGHPSSIRS